MTRATMREPTSSKQFVADHIRASNKVMKKVLRSKKSARAFLVKAGILNKSGKLTKPYRPE